MGTRAPKDFYECEAVMDAAGQSMHLEPLPEQEWRYYVVSTPENGAAHSNMHLSSNISEVVMELSALHFTDRSYGMRSGIIHNELFGWFAGPAKRIGENELRDIANVYKSLSDLTKGGYVSSEYPEVSRALDMYDSLSLLPRNSQFHALGLFAIIEMLITHNPKLEDRGDSITHQMQSKIPLLSKRFEKPLDYPNFFPGETDKRIWSALYGYRSAIAHGGMPDFQKDHKILRNADNANAFLREMVKALLRHALREPQLYRDLRNC